VKEYKLDSRQAKTLKNLRPLKYRYEAVNWKSIEISRSVIP